MGKMRIGMSSISDTVYLGKVNKNNTEWVGEKRDVTNNFIDVMHQYLEVATIRTIKHQDGVSHVFIHLTEDIESIDGIIKHLKELKSKI